MNKRVLLNNVEHGKLRVVTRHGREFGDCANQVLIFPTEFEDVQREYPILFRRNAEGEFQAVALTGLDRDENLFLEGDRWQARYVPAVQRRGPFSIGIQERRDAGEPQQEAMIHVDLDDPRISTTEGEPLFLAQGGNSPHLEGIARTLRVIYEGLEIEKPMFRTFEEMGLIQPITLEMQLSETEKYKVPDVFTISSEGMSQLQGEGLERLYRSGLLRTAFFVISSLGNLSRIIELKNSKRAAGA